MDYKELLEEIDRLKEIEQTNNTQRANDMNETLEQIALRIGKEIYDSEFTSVASRNRLIEFSRRLLEEIGKQQEPLSWNQVQVCTWIGNQLMHNPSMFERKEVCRYVRSLGRDTTLAKHFTPHPTPEEVKDAVDGYKVGCCTDNTIRLHYETSQQAEKAFDALTLFMDKAIGKAAMSTELGTQGDGK